MHILLYAPDNQVAKNFVPHLWPFVLKRLTPEPHRVSILDANATPYSPQALAEYVRDNKVDLVGMGFMTRMAQAAYRAAAAIREQTRVPVVMGGPHVTEVPHEPLGLTGLLKYADAVVRGEADDLWPIIVRDAEMNNLQPLYEPPLVGGRDVKPSLKNYPVVPWDEIDLRHFNLLRHLPPWVRTAFRKLGYPHEAVYVIPMESGRGCPYGCDFCTVTGFFGDQIRFRDNDNVIAELRRLKTVAKRDKAFVLVCFVDDNLAINLKRTKSLLRDMIKHDVCFCWWGQITMNLLRDEELVTLMAASGARSILVGLESVSSDSLKAANKSFNKPAEYETILANLARHDIFAIPSFIFGLEADPPGVADRTIEAIRSWPPSVPVFGVLTPYPGTPLYRRLAKEGRLTRPEHWLDFQAFKAAYVPKLMSPDEVQTEVHRAWTKCYEPSEFRRTQRWMLENHKPFMWQMTLFVVRLFFRGIYIPQTTRRDWVRLLRRNLPTMTSLARSGCQELVAARAKGPLGPESVASTVAEGKGQ